MAEPSGGGKKRKKKYKHRTKGGGEHPSGLTVRETTGGNRIREQMLFSGRTDLNCKKCPPQVGCRVEERRRVRSTEGNPERKRRQKQLNQGITLKRAPRGLVRLGVIGRREATEYRLILVQKHDGIEEWRGKKFGTVNLVDNLLIEG